MCPRPWVSHDPPICSLLRHKYLIRHYRLSLWGNPNHLGFVASSLREAYGEDKLHILNAKRNSGSFTYDGIELGGERVAQEIEECLDELARSGQIIHQLSVVGYSLGGLVARYAIGLLYHKGYFDRLEAVNFTTFVTPHLGTIAPSDGAQNPRANDFRGADAVGWYAEQSVECARRKNPIDVWSATFHNRLLSQHRKTSAQRAGRPGQHIHAWAGKIQE